MGWSSNGDNVCDNGDNDRAIHSSNDKEDVKTKICSRSSALD